MKKLLTTLILITPYFLAFGQVNYIDSREMLLSDMQKNKKFRAHIVATKTVTVQKYVYKHNSQNGSLSVEMKYDSRGNFTDWTEYKGNGKVAMHNNDNYDDSNRVTQFVSFSGSGKQNEKYTYIYDKWGNQLEQDRYKRDSKTPISKETHSYNDRNNITETKVFDKKGDLKSRIVYTYYDDGSKKQTIRYSGKGKVKRIWNFDCNPVGTQEAKGFKDTSKVCIHFETDKDGNQIKVKEEYERNGGLFDRATRDISKYDKNDNILEYSMYKLNGKLIFHWTISYDASGNITEYVIYRAGTNKPYWRTTYTYNSDGNISSSTMYKKSNPVPNFTQKWVYNPSLTNK